MKIKDGFMLSEVAGSYVVVPVGAVQADFTGMITLNPVGAFLWGKLEKETTRDELLKVCSHGTIQTKRPRRRILTAILKSSAKTDF